MDVQTRRKSRRASLWSIDPNLDRLGGLVLLCRYVVAGRREHSAERCGHGVELFADGERVAGEHFPAAGLCFEVEPFLGVGGGAWGGEWHLFYIKGVGFEKRCGKKIDEVRWRVDIGYLRDSNKIGLTLEGEDRRFYNEYLVMVE